MRTKLKILLLIFMIIVVSSACIEPRKQQGSNETTIATSEPTSEQKLPDYNEIKPVEINVTFETWSRGYYSNISYRQPYFRLITNYSEWNEFLDEQGYPRALEGELYPGVFKKPKNITSADFAGHSIITAMMGRQGITEGPEIEIKKIFRTNNIVNVTIRMYKATVGAMVESAPYHVVLVKKEFLPRGNSTFVFMDTEGKELEKIEVRE